jgi:hypothetical protein
MSARGLAWMTSIRHASPGDRHRWRWVTYLAVAVPQFLLVGGSIAPTGRDNLTDPGSFGPFAEQGHDCSAHLKEHLARRRRMAYVADIG